MAVIEFTYKVTLKFADQDILKLTEFLTRVKELGGDAKLLKTQAAKD